MENNEKDLESISLQYTIFCLVLEFQLEQNKLFRKNFLGITCRGIENFGKLCVIPKNTLSNSSSLTAPPTTRKHDFKSKLYQNDICEQRTGKL